MSRATPTVAVDAGLLVGTTTSLPGATASALKFLGVPFAARPARFAPPERPVPWSKALRAVRWRESCVQQFVGMSCARPFISPPPPFSPSLLPRSVRDGEGAMC